MQRDNGLDTAKGIASVFVLMLHLLPIQSSVPIVFNTMAFLWNHVFIVAVPVFYMISLLILFEKSNWKYIKRRVKRLADIYLFWCTFNFLFYLLSNSILLEEVQLYLIKFTINTSIFYFLFNLIILTLCSYYWLKIPDRYRFIASPVLIVLFSLYFSCIEGLSLRTIDNFLIYIPIVDLLRRVKVKWYQAHSAALVWGFFTAFEVLDLIPNTSTYARVSVVAGALFVYFITRSLKPGILEPFAKYSLGVYALHLYAQAAVVKLLPEFHFSLVGFHIAPLVVFTLTLALMFAVILILEKTFLRKYIQ